MQIFLNLYNFKIDAYSQEAETSVYSLILGLKLNNILMCKTFVFSKKIQSYIVEG